MLCLSESVRDPPYARGVVKTRGAPLVPVIGDPDMGLVEVCGEAMALRFALVGLSRVGGGWYFGH